MQQGARVTSCCSIPSGLPMRPLRPARPRLRAGRSASSFLAARSSAAASPRVRLRTGTRRSAAIWGSVIPADLRSLRRIAIATRSVSAEPTRARAPDLVTVPSVCKKVRFLAPVLEARTTKPHGTPRGETDSTASESPDWMKCRDQHSAPGIGDRFVYGGEAKVMGRWYPRASRIPSRARRLASTPVGSRQPTGIVD
jgi:hypothetical protein